MRAPPFILLLLLLLLLVLLLLQGFYVDAVFCSLIFAERCARRDGGPRHLVGQANDLRCSVLLRCGARSLCARCGKSTLASHVSLESTSRRGAKDPIPLRRHHVARRAAGRL
ncbi:unnamed protein product [Prorocentrum cordatum]|uniref:Secreted protein n=1 Tax=Prorocentrum cordatum TaxID=2364126 RepID=A0ABN9YD20_9DINO|nr:unnamed protein product [Polarella glacialis]